MPVIGLTSEEFTRVFGPRDPLDSGPPGRSRKCRTCGDWHRMDRPWPHNCRVEAPPRNHDLASPQVAPRFEAFVTGGADEPVVIGDRRDKREYMARNDLAEYDAGVGKRNSWVEDRKRGDEIVETIKRFQETDTDYWDPEYFGRDPERDNLKTGGLDVDPSVAERVE